MAEERLQKLLARAGIASRRAAETLITEGRVRVNGRVVRELGTRADLGKDKIEVDGQRIVREQPVYYVLHKPREVVTTLEDPEGRETVGQLIRRIPERVYPIGRLDYHTSGVLLLTNDGEMAQALLHPRKRVPKTYIAKFKGHLPVAKLGALRNGVVLDDGHRTAPAELFVTREERGNTWLQITIHEGKNRQIHRMGEAIGHRVMRLTRVAFAGITIEGLPPGRYRPLKGEELRKLKRDYKNPRQRHREKAARTHLADARYGAPAPDTAEPTPAKRPFPKKRAAKRRTQKTRTAKTRTASLARTPSSPPRKAAKKHTAQKRTPRKRRRKTP